MGYSQLTYTKRFGVDGKLAGICSYIDGILKIKGKSLTLKKKADFDNSDVVDIVVYGVGFTVYRTFDDTVHVSSPSSSTSFDASDEIASFLGAMCEEFIEDYKFLYGVKCDFPHDLYSSFSYEVFQYVDIQLRNLTKKIIDRRWDDAVNYIDMVNKEAKDKDIGFEIDSEHKKMMVEFINQHYLKCVELGITDPLTVDASFIGYFKRTDGLDERYHNVELCYVDDTSNLVNGEKTIEVRFTILKSAYGKTKSRFPKDIKINVEELSEQLAQHIESLKVTLKQAEFIKQQLSAPDVRVFGWQ